MNKLVIFSLFFLITTKSIFADILIGGNFNSYFKLIDANIYNFYYNDKYDDEITNDFKAAYQISNGYFPSFKIGYATNSKRIYFEYQRLKKSGIYSKGFDADINVEDYESLDENEIKSQIISDINNAQLDLSLFKLSNDWIFNISKSFDYYFGLNLALAKVNRGTDSLNTEPRYKKLDIEYNSFMLGGGLQTGFLYNFYKYCQLELGLSGTVLAGTTLSKLHDDSEISSKGVVTQTSKAIVMPNLYLGLNFIF